MASIPNTIESFMSKVYKTDSCWLWTGSVRSEGLPYGRYRFYGRNRQTNRISWMIHKGGIPPKHNVKITCKIPNCVNPDHLELVETKYDFETQEVV
jgi:hypothetical protein